MGNLTVNFSEHEYRCGPGLMPTRLRPKVPEEFMGNVKRNAQALQILRNYLNVPIRINSGYRTKEHNEKVGGVPTSHHLTGDAADICSRLATPPEIGIALKRLREAGMLPCLGEVIVHNTFVHVSTKGPFQLWHA